MAENHVSGPDTQKLIDRVKSILLKPREEWPVIASEPDSTRDILVKYVLPLAAIGPVSAFIGGQLFGYGGFGITIRPSFTGALSQLIIAYVMTIVGVFVLAAIANFLAGKFGGQQDNSRAFKLVVYSATAGWVAGIFGLIPSLSWLGILGLYGIYLFYTGAVPLMHVPQEKAGGYTAVTIVAAVIIFAVIGIVTSALAGAFGGAARIGSFAGSDDEVSGTVNIPGMGSIDVGQAQATADRMEKMAKGEIKPVEASKMRDLLPDSIGGYERVARESSAMGGMGSQAEATYAKGDDRFKLRILDTFAMGGLAGMAAMMNIEREAEDEDSYERVRKVGDHMVAEEWNHTSNRGKYGVFFGDRFMIEASGQAASIDELKSAVATVDQGDLADLAG